MSIDKQDIANQKHKNDTGEASVLNFLDKELLATAKPSSSQIPSLEDLDALVSNLLEEAIKDSDTQRVAEGSKSESLDHRLPDRIDRRTVSPLSPSSEPPSDVDIRLTRTLEEVGLVDIEDRVLHQVGLSPKKEGSLRSSNTNTSGRTSPPAAATNSIQLSETEKAGRGESASYYAPVEHEKEKKTDNAPLFAPVAQKTVLSKRVLIMAILFLTLAAAIGGGSIYFGSRKGSQTYKSNENSMAMNYPGASNASAVLPPQSLPEVAKQAEGSPAPVLKSPNDANTTPVPDANNNAKSAATAKKREIAVADSPKPQAQVNPPATVVSSQRAPDESPVPPPVESPTDNPQPAPSLPVNSPPAVTVQPSSQPVAAQVQPSAASMKTESAPPPAKPVENIVPESFYETPAVPVSRVTPRYPESAIRMNISGTVRVEAIIDDQGRVTKAKALDGNLLLRSAAEESVLQWRYSPATINGKPTSTKITILISFKK
jgi:periplasmic protein TonB